MRKDRSMVLTVLCDWIQRISNTFGAVKDFQSVPSWKWFQRFLLKFWGILEFSKYYWWFLNFQRLPKGFLKVKPIEKPLLVWYCDHFSWDSEVFLSVSDFEQRSQGVGYLRGTRVNQSVAGRNLKRRQIQEPGGWLGVEIRNSDLTGVRCSSYLPYLCAHGGCV